MSREWMVRSVMWACCCLPLMSSPAADDPRAFPPDEPAFAARLAGIDREWNLSFWTAGKVRVVASKELAYWGRHRDAETGPQIVLAGGGVIRSDVLALDERRITLGDAAGLGRGLWEEASLPREAVQAILFQPPAAADERDRLLIALGGERGSEDRLQLFGGETVTGTLTSAPRAGRLAATDATPGAEVFEISRRGTLQPLVIPAAKVIAVQFGGGVQPPPPSGARIWLGFSDGSLVRVNSLSVNKGIVTLALVTGGELKSSLTGRDDKENAFWEAITYVEPESPRIKWLAGCEAIGFKQISFLSVQRQYSLDQSVLGTRLRADSGIFRSGLGMPSASRLAFDVAGYRKFQSELAIDAKAGLRGSAVFKVLLEGEGGQWQIAYESPIIRGGDAPLTISADLKGAARMALIVDFADRGDECDYADWLMARLVR